MNYMITYQKENGNIFFRLRKTPGELHIGDITSMGWKVLDIHQEYEGNYLHKEDIRRLINHKVYKTPMKKRIIRFIIRKLNKIA